MQIFRVLAVALLIGGLSACASPSAQPTSASRQPSAPVTPLPSSAPSATDTSSASEPAEEDPEDVGELFDYGYDSEAGREAGQHVQSLLLRLSERHSTLRYGFSAAVKKVSFDPDVDDTDKELTIVFDRVTWNSKFTDGGTEDPAVNPTVKWETLHCPQLVALASPGSGRISMSTKQLAAYVQRQVKQHPSSPAYFSFYFNGKTLVAIDEWFLP